MKKNMLITGCCVMIVALSSGCSDLQASEESFNGVACVAFEAGIVAFNTNTAIHFENCSKGGSYYLWDFGDGLTSNEFEPTHTYLEEGNYHLQLVVQDEEFEDYNRDGRIAVDDRIEGKSDLLDLYLEVKSAD